MAPGITSAIPDLIDISVNNQHREDRRHVWRGKSQKHTSLIEDTVKWDAAESGTAQTDVRPKKNKVSIETNF